MTVNAFPSAATAIMREIHSTSIQNLASGKTTNVLYISEWSRNCCGGVGDDHLHGIMRLATRNFSDLRFTEASSSVVSYDRPSGTSDKDAITSLVDESVPSFLIFNRGTLRVLYL